MPQRRPPPERLEPAPSGDATVEEDMAARLSRIIEEFHAADGRMRDLPVYNPALSVEAVGFRPWNGAWLGVMVSPWFINLMLVPVDAGAWRDLVAGSKVRWSFPSGTVEFIVGVGDICGPYQCCSLFSPVLEFEDQEAARQTVQAALTALMTPDLLDDAEESAAAAAAIRPSGPVNRRQVLRGDLPKRPPS